MEAVRQPSLDLCFSKSVSPFLGCPCPRRKHVVRLDTRLGFPRTVCMAKGFGAPGKVTSKGLSPGGKAKESLINKLPSNLPSDSETDACSCGEKRSYKECCGRYHGGVKEPDAVTLLRARYTAFARGLAPYIVRTTHPENPDVKHGGPEQLKADCEETSRRIVFKRLEIGEVEVSPSASEAKISFKAIYTYKHGTTTENQLLEEKSKFAKSGDRWLYLEKLPTDPVSDALWRHGTLLSEQSAPPASTLPKGVFGRAQPKLRPRSR